ncbi:protein ADM2a [Mugil cephalus]|uniref:protein ADM2a n=1 Tax=Mugil cephalus TaxID=48193 RepID=UPI001FB80E3C|nr:protein ADM2a [Mugil cephalus]
MSSFLRLAVYCISLISLQELLALPAQRPDKNRVDLLRQLTGQAEENSLASGSQTNSAIPSSAPSQSPKWLSGFLRHQPASRARLSPPGLAWAQPAKVSRTVRRPLRARRHAHSGSRGLHHPPQLMRVGCVLGTCQVQNLSHRLYQLIGQNGREDSSPINPKSPHSYG